MTLIGCGKNLRELREKLDAFHVQTKPSREKYQGSNENRCLLHRTTFFYIISPSDLLYV